MCHVILDPTNKDMFEKVEGWTLKAQLSNQNKLITMNAWFTVILQYILLIITTYDFIIKTINNTSRTKSIFPSNEEGNDQKYMQSSITPDPRHHMGK